MANDPVELNAIAEAALGFVQDGMTLGLGTGHAATAFIHALGERVKAGLKVRGVPTSQVSADLAKSLGIPLTTLDEVDALDLAVDGADEVATGFNELIKGYGGALLREKIVASAAKKFVVVVGSEKLVAKLGERGRLPVEIVPFAAAHTARRLPNCSPRLEGGKQVVSDNGNFLYDCKIEPLDNPAVLDRDIRRVPGVVETGFFVDFNPIVLVGRGDRVEMLNPWDEAIGNPYSEAKP
jgi:ribose 5-phosphate isomerase A